MPAKKRIALVAHDNLKVKMVDWCIKWKNLLTKHQLMGTGTTEDFRAPSGSNFRAESILNRIDYKMLDHG